MAALKEDLAVHGGRPVKTTPFGTGPKHDLDEWRAVKAVFQRGTIPMTRGPEVMALRGRFCRLFGAKHAVTTSSGTAALHTAMAALGVGRGDEVITSPVTDMGTLVAILAQNAVPVFADVDPETLMVTPETVAAKITPRTAAVILVHLEGLPADARGVVATCRRKGIPVVEDLAQSYLSKQAGRYSGTFGEIGCWSLNESKHIGAGDGGVLLTRSRKLARRADLFADKCYDRQGGRIGPSFAPMNYRLNDLVAAVSLQQLGKLRWICATRHRHGTRLDRALGGIEGVRPRPVRKGDYATYWHYVCHVDPSVLRCSNRRFARALSAEGVPAQHWTLNVMDWTLFRKRTPDPYACAEACPLYKGPKPNYDTASYPGVQEALRRAVRFGMSEFYTPDDVGDVIRAVRKVAAYYRR